MQLLNKSTLLWHLSPGFRWNYVHMANVNPSLQQLSELIIPIFISLFFLADPSGVALHDHLQTISSISAYLAPCLQALLKKCSVLLPAKTDAFTCLEGEKKQGGCEAVSITSTWLGVSEVSVRHESSLWCHKGPFFWPVCFTMQFLRCGASKRSISAEFVDNTLSLESIDKVHNMGPLNANAELFNTGIWEVADNQKWAVWGFSSGVMSSKAIINMRTDVW